MKTYYNYFKPLEILPLNSVSLSPEASRKMKAYVARMLPGNTIDYRTNMFALPQNIAKFNVPNSRIPGIKGFVPIPRAGIANSFIPHILESLRDFPKLKRFEESFIKYSTSSRSIQLPGEELKSKLEQSFSFADFVPDAEAYEALKLASQELKAIYRKYIRERSLRPLSFKKALDQMTATSSGGAPFFVDGQEGRSGVLYKDNRFMYLNVAHRILDCIKNQGGHIPLEYIMFYALTRIQEADVSNGPNVKNRIVGGDPHGATILAAVSFPFLNACAEIPQRDILKGLSYTNESLASLIRERIKRTYLSADQSAFDNHINANIVREFINPIIMDSFNWDHNPDAKIGLQWYLDAHMGESPIYTPSGIYSGSHGMPSGVLFVNEIDSMYLMLITLAINHLQNKYKFDVIKVQGDDGVFSVPGHQVKQDVVDVYVEGCQRYNLDVNPAKQEIDYFAILFTKRYWCLETPNGYRSKIGSLVGLMNMEHVKNWQDPMQETRAGAILSNHYITDPSIGEFFTQIMLGFPEYQLGYKLPGGYIELVRLSGGVKSVSSRLDLGSGDNMLAALNTSTGEAELDINKMSIALGIETLKKNKVPLPQSGTGAVVASYLKSIEGKSKNARNRLRKRNGSNLSS